MNELIDASAPCRHRRSLLDLPSAKGRWERSAEPRRRGAEPPRVASSLSVRVRPPGSVLSALEEFVKEPTKTVDFIGASIPQTSRFFMRRAPHPLPHPRSTHHTHPRLSKPLRRPRSAPTRGTLRLTHPPALPNHLPTRAPAATSSSSPSAAPCPSCPGWSRELFI